MCSAGVALLLFLLPCRDTLSVLQWFHVSFWQVGAGGVQVRMCLGGKQDLMGFGCHWGWTQREQGVRLGSTCMRQGGQEELPMACTPLPHACQDKMAM